MNRERGMKPDILHQPRTTPALFIDPDGNTRKLSETDPSLNAAQRVLIDALEVGPGVLRDFDEADVLKLQVDGWIVPMVYAKIVTEMVFTAWSGKKPADQKVVTIGWTTNTEAIAATPHENRGFGLKSMVLNGMIDAPLEIIRYCPVVAPSATTLPDVPSVELESFEVVCKVEHDHHFEGGQRYWFERKNHIGRFDVVMSRNGWDVHDPARICDSDVEGSRDDMNAMIAAIEQRHPFNADYCAVDFHQGRHMHDGAIFTFATLFSPRYSKHPMLISLEHLDGLAESIRARLIE